MAGGKSSRFGTNKALASIGGKPLIERVVGVMGRVFDRTVLITNTPEVYGFLGLPMIEDLVKGMGPLGGIYTALKTLPEGAVFCVGADMPCLREGLIRHMVEVRGHYDVVVPRVGWKIEALHALFRKTCIPAIESLIQSGSYQVFRFFHAVSVLEIGQEEIVRFDPELRSFYNINLPSEWREFVNAPEGRLSAS